MAEERRYFPFYQNYLDAALELTKAEERCQLVYALCYTGLTGQEPDMVLKGGAAAAYKLAKPVLQGSFVKAQNASKSGSKTQANTEANAEQNPEQNESETLSYNKNKNNNNNYLSKEKEKRERFSQQKTSKPSPFVQHGEVSPLMKEAADRLRKEEMA